MKKYLSSLVIMLSFVMQSLTMLADGIQPINTPVILQPRKAPWIVGNPKPTKSDPNLESPVSVYLNEVSDSLLLYSSSEESVTYYIYDADELEVCNGNVTFSEQGEASIYVGTLNEGVYTIYVVVDDDVYGGEFQL
jgi:hypothetical protein